MRIGGALACAMLGAVLACSEAGNGFEGDGSAVSPDGLPDVAPADSAEAELGRQEADEAGVELAERPETRQPVCNGGIVPRVLESSPDETFDLGPYLMTMTPTSAVVMWRTLDPLAGRVYFSPASAPAGSEPVMLEEASPTLVHEVELTGLAPATIYSYQVGAGQALSTWHELETPPASPGPVRLAAWGDSHNGSVPFSALLAQMLADGPHAALGLGDHVNDGLVAEMWKEQLFNPTRALFHQVPFYAALGNHEHNSPTWYELFHYPEPVTSIDPMQETIYGITLGNVYLLVVNTNTVFFPIGDLDVPLSARLRELAQSPEAATATWRIAYGHEPGYSESWSPGDCGFEGYLPVRNWLLPMLEENGFQLYLSGHSHVYERAKVGKLVHLISGGGGGGLDEWCRDLPETSVVVQRHHYLRIDADCGRLRVEAVDTEGLVFDWVELDASLPGQLVEEGPIDGLEPLIVSSDSPTRP